MKTILVIDDAALNRDLLRKLLGEQYTVLEAENGRKGLYILEHSRTIDLLILDLVMPEMDGFEVLRAMRGNRVLNRVPVVVVTADTDVDSMIGAFDLGAMDVLTKPFNAQVMLHRIANILDRKSALELAEQNQLQKEQLYLTTHDGLTGLYNRSAFIREARALLAGKKPESYVLSYLDVDDFKLINDRYGHEEGDKLLRYIAEIRQHEVDEIGGIACRDMADVFLSLIPNERRKIQEVFDRTLDALREYGLPSEISIHVGRYAVEDCAMDVNLMIDRALLAMRSIKGSREIHEIWFDDGMRRELLRKQELVESMRPALESGQFVPYFQPQYNFSSSFLSGAEALVRWIHPEKGIISPAEFIPLFEQNGMISELDLFMWEAACKHLRRWIDLGLNPPSVSVNISRRDFRALDLTKVIIEIVRKYELKPEMLHLEITESAYVDNPQELVSVVSELQKQGFTVEMDDFGSGYSSLNTLKDVPVDILKLDLRFNTETDEKGRGGSILSSVVRMARWLKLPVIAEGVETGKQADYLKSIGCNLMQGYYFAKPMPADDYESLLKTVMKEGTETIFDTRVKGAVDFLDASTQATLLFNSFVGGAQIIEYDGKIAEALRINDRFFELIGCTREEFQAEKNILVRFDEENQEKLKHCFEVAFETGKESECELCSKPIKAGGKDIWTSCRIRFLAQNQDRSVFYLSVENINDRKELEERLETECKRSEALIANAPGGVVTLSVDGERVYCEFFSEGMCRLLKCTEESVQSQLKHGISSFVYPEDCVRVEAEFHKCIKNKIKFSENYRVLRSDNTPLWVNTTGNPVQGKDGILRYYCLYTDISEYVDK